MCWVMLGQNGPALVGLPEYGVTLTGTLEHPEIVNNSGRTILGYIIWQRDANGGGPPVMPLLKTTEMRSALIRPASASGPTVTPPQSGVRTTVNAGPVYTFSNGGGVTGGNIIQTVLQNIVFGDGEFVGTDRFYYFDNLSARIDAERSLAQDVLTGRVSWEQLEARAREHPRTTLTSWGGAIPFNLEDAIEAVSRSTTQRILIQDLLQARAKYGEAAALAMADLTAKLPVLWRAAQ